VVNLTPRPLYPGDRIPGTHGGRWAPGVVWPLQYVVEENLAAVGNRNV